jgi:uncharacterized protein (DUF1697 family)
MSGTAVSESPVSEDDLRTFIALLRGINVGGRNRIPMGELCSVCVALDWTDVRSHIQSGNLIFRADGTRAMLEAQLEQAIERQFGLTIPVIVRPAASWPQYIQDNPYPEISQREPQLVILGLSKASPKPGAAEALAQRATMGETITQVGDALWIHYAGGAGRSKLSPGLLDRLTGSPVTTRNWRTVLQLEKLSRSS